jgi:hypothetical protein
MGRGTSKGGGTGAKSIHDVMLTRKSNKKWQKGINMAAEKVAKRKARKGK